MAEERIRLGDEHQTYLSTLYGKALDARSEDPILGDTYAEEAVERIDFDFDRLNLPSGGAVTLPIRAKHLDSWVREFLDANPEAVVLNLGCGLDSRVFRMDPQPEVRWYDVDLPDVVELRKRLYPDRTAGYELIAASVTEAGWLGGIPSNRPAILVAEGMVMYLTEEDGIALFTRIVEKFPRGQFVFDAYSRLTEATINMAARFGPTPVRLHWSFNDPHKIEGQVPGLELMDAVPFLTLPELVERLGTTRGQRAFGRLYARIGFLRNSILHLRYRF